MLILLRNHLFFLVLLLWLSMPLHAQVFGDKPVAIDMLSHEPYRRTFAKPLPLDNGQTMYFERDGTRAVIWRLDWHSNMATPTVVANLPVEDDKKRYTAIATSKGIWLIGPVVFVLKTDGTTAVLPTFAADEPTAVALHDGSVLVLGSGMHNHTEQMRRLVLNAQGVAVEDKGLLPHYLSGKDVNYKARYGVAAVTLADGRVFTAGGGSSGDLQRAAMIDPQNGFAVQSLPDMPHKRTYAAVVQLPDGRIVAAGHEHLRCYDQDVRTVDIYNPKTNLWQSLPDLPFPLCSDAYGADGPAAVALPDGTIVLGGYLEQQLMALHPDANGANGYAKHWEVIASMDRMRISGVLQQLSNSEVVIAGGVHHLDFGGCCYGTPGAQRVRMPANRGEQSQFQSVGMPLQGVGVAQRNGKLFIASGHQFSFTRTGQMRYSTLAEILDLKTGNLQQLPDIPFVTGGAQVAWLDDNRVLVKGQVVEEGARGFTPGSDLASYMPVSSGAMAVYSVSQRQWSQPFDPEALRAAMLLRANGEEIIFITASDATLHRLHWSTQQLEALATSPAAHTGVVARYLPDDRIIIAGGDMQRQRISLIDDNCETTAADPAKDCEEQFTGWGPMQPALRYQLYNPSSGGEQNRWQSSEPDSLMGTYDQASEVLQTLIDKEGRVIRFVHPSSSCCDKTLSSLWLERSSSDGKNWQSLPVPAGIITQDDEKRLVLCKNGCHLLLATDPRHPEKELLFLREGALENDYASEIFDRDNFHKDDARASTPLHVWWLDETASTPQWQEVLQADASAMRRQPLSLTGPLAGVQSMGWHLAQPVLWLGQ